MLYVHEAIKGPAELELLWNQMKFYHRRYTYHAAGIKSISPPNPFVTQHRLNDHQRRIMVQGDGDHDLCTGDAKAMVVLTSTQASRPSNRQWTHTADSRVEVQGDGAGDHYTGGGCAHTTVLIAST